MILRFATKRGRSGNRYFVGMNTDNKTFARESAHWYTRDDLTSELTRKQRRDLITQLENAGYKEIEHI